MIILGTNSIKDTGYDVANSLRFNSASNDHLNRTQTGGNRRKFTFSTWVKRCNPATRMALFLANRSSSNYDQFYLNEGGYIEADFYHSGTQIFRYKTNALYRDPSAWYHIILAVDTEHSSASSRVRIYVNGLEVTSFSTETNPSQDVDTHVNENSIVAYIGSDYNSNEPDYYLAETVMLDGTQATPTDFGEFDSDSGIWKPKNVSGLTFGTNGFYLDFEDSSALGNDAAGSNNFTVNNLTSLDQSVDSCTNNFATFNPLDKLTTGAPTGSEGNLKLTGDTSSNNTWNSTIGLSAGKWYVEMKVLQSSPDTSIIFRSQTNTSGSHNNSYGFDTNPDTKMINGSSSGSAIGSTSQNDILGMALDLDNGKMFIHRNGTYFSSGDPANGTNPFIQTSDGLPSEGVIGGHIYNGSVEWNFGSPSFSISSGNTDGNGYGNFEFAVPANYYAINTKNLAEYG